MPEIAIQVENLWKQYRLGAINHGTLRRDLQSWWASLRGKDDPNLSLSSKYNLERISKAGVCGSEAADRFWALKNVSFSVRQGEVIGIIGRNGAGKSTLLKILSQVTTPTRGEVRIKGRIASLLEVGTGFHPELTGRENIFLNGAILGMNRAEIRRKLDEIIAFAEVEKFVDTPVKRYSSGMYVRLAFAVAAHLESEILIVDEVLAVGDISFQEKCLKKMDDVTSHGKTVLFVSHNLSAVRRLCEKIMWMDYGEVRQFSLPDDILAKYNSELISKGSRSGGVFVRNPEDIPARDTWVNEVHLLDMNNSPATIFKYGDNLKISFWLAGNSTRVGTSLAWMLADSHGNNIAWSNSFLTCGFYLEEGVMNGSCELVNLPLAVGSYIFSFSCGIVASGEPKDIWRDAAFFEIVSCNPYNSKAEHLGGSRGPIMLNQLWK